ncbi:hypothetical protein GCM10007981_12590 [Thermocladium modestius]|uniref:Uncharacterized protein n=1 Tax=Thermocladium modestius TaxID=62609 RepID=A0A830GWQ0_9CREN|nr:hypothetical protein [Thermocladium modestius]GGP21306.1 hypothetical protein GCM10007981_12590 [Thermocladium modestius]
MSWVALDLERAVEKASRFYVDLLKAGIDSTAGGVVLLDMILLNRPGELGRVLTAIGSSTGKSLLTAYATTEVQGQTAGGGGVSKFGFILLVYPAVDEADAARVAEAAKGAGAISVTAYFIRVKEVMKG